MPNDSPLRRALCAAALRFANDITDAIEAHLAGEAVKHAPSAAPRRRPSPPAVPPPAPPSPEAAAKAERALRRAGLTK